MKSVFIVSAKRTPVGGFLGSLSHLSATELGAQAIRGAYSAVPIDPSEIGAVYMGNVLSANVGQSPARQAAKYAGIADHIDATTINKVCASGLKAVMIGAQQIQLGLEEMIVSGGMESMSNVPHYAFLRQTKKLGDAAFVDGLLKDGLTDAYNQLHMGNAAELCVKTYKISREEQDAYAIRSYQLAQDASNQHKFDGEIIPVELTKKGESIQMTRDEDIDKLIFEKVPLLKPSFEKNGTITAANASNLNDGAAALLLVSEETLKRYNLKPLARIVSYADAAQAPEWFTTSPSLAIPKALKQAGLSLNEIDYIELNEAYAAVAIANQRILHIDPKKLNVYGGAVAIGHPLGASGARILCTLLSVLRQEGGHYGMAAICNGGGGASAMVVERL